MNRLGKELEKVLEKGIPKEEYEVRFDEFLKLYYKLRSQEEDRWWSKLSLEQRQRIHSLILGVYKAKNKLSGFSYKILADKRTPTDRPIIFAPTHIGKFDIENISEAIQSHYYLLSGDYEHIQGIIDAPFLGLNGVFYFNEKVKEDRKSVTEKMINHLLNNGNLLYFIEGTWNLTPNLPVLPCYWGIIDIARKTNAIIVPIGVEQYGKQFKINIGENFDVNNYDSNLEGKTLAIGDLRDTLATLKWEIWETEHTTHDLLKDYNWQDYIDTRFSEWPGFNKEYIQDLIYRPKGIITPLDVFNTTSEIDMTEDTNISASDYAFKLRAVKDAKRTVEEYRKHYF